MSKEKCPYCGSSETKKKTEVGVLGFTEETFTWCSNCGIQVGAVIAKITEESFNLFRTEGMSYKEWNQYVKEYDIDMWDMWQMYFWAKNEQNEIIVDVSEENIKRCEQLYNKSHDEDNHSFTRLLFLKIFAGKESKQLASELLNLLDKKIGGRVIPNILYLLSFEIINKELYRAIEPYLPRLRDFLLWLIDVRPNVFKYLLYDNFDSAMFDFGPLCRLIGSDNVFKNNIDLEEILRLNNQDIIACDADYQCYLLAEYCYKENKWLEAFFMFEKLRMICESQSLNGEDPICPPLYEDYCKMGETPHIENIKNRSRECFKKIFETKESERFYNVIVRLNNLNEHYIVKIQRLGNDVGSYLRFYNIFSEIIKGNYKEAFNQWVRWDKKGTKFIELDISSTTRYLRNLKDGTGNKENNLKGLLSGDSFVKVGGSSIIQDLEGKIREFIRENLILYYKKRFGWERGVPLKIRQQARAIQEEDPRSSIWGCLNFSDYSEIICFKENWNNIFKKYFVIKKTDANQKKEDLTAFLKGLVPLRNLINHGRRPLTKEEGKKLKEYRDSFYRVYESWKKDNKGSNYAES